jgi:hypothetical protein
VAAYYEAATAMWTFKLIKMRDLGDFRVASEEHARSIAREVRRIIEIDFEREAVV